MEALIRNFLNIGFGSGDGDGSGFGSGSGDGSGFGDGSGSGSGYGIKSFCGKNVYHIDGVQTLLFSVKGNIAKGAILNSDFTTTSCYVVKNGNHFAHGETLKKAISALDGKIFQDIPPEERINKFIESHPDFNKLYPAGDLFDWHNKLTGSCEMGRKSFAKDRGINLDSDSFTVIEFVDLTKRSYGSEIICYLENRIKNET